MSNWSWEISSVPSKWSPDELNCFEEIIYEFDISNVGTNFMNITRVEVTTNGVTFRSWNRLKSTPWPWSRRRPSRKIGPSASRRSYYLVELDVDADSPDGGTCFANDTYRFDNQPCKCQCRIIVHSGWNQR
jgi:hypothetical protein